MRVFEGGLWGVALVAAGYLSYVALDREVFETQQTKRLLELSRTVAPAALASRVTVAPPSAATRQLVENGEPIGRLEIPSADISVMVAAGTDSLTLRRGVGHIQGTALPGEPGNVGLAGHRDTVFRGLRNLKLADRIVLVTPAGSFEYAVESLQTVEPERSDVLEPSSHPTLTLVTCYPFDFIGPAPLRFIVRAREIGRTEEASRAADPNRDASQDVTQHP